MLGVQHTVIEKVELERQGEEDVPVARCVRRGRGRVGVVVVGCGHRGMTTVRVLADGAAWTRARPGYICRQRRRG